MDDTGLNRRQALLWKLFDFSPGRGLEIGPLHSTAVPKSLADVRYLDVFDRHALCEHYADDPGVPTELIPDIDYVLFDGERVRSIPETVGQSASFDWVMASHVIEHVPDAIGWLDEIASITVDGGALVLAVPDRRYCFDLHRPGTSLGQMLQAHELGDRVPSIRAVYDYKRGHASVRAPDIWAGNPVGYENRIYTLSQVQECAARARAGEYVDSHVWLFTPGSFVEQVIELRTLGLTAWRIESLIPTRRNELEFYAVLRRLPRSGHWPAELFAGEPHPGTMPDWVAEAAATTRELDRVRVENAALREQAATARKTADRARRELSELRERQRAAERARFRSRFRARVRRLPGFAVLRGIRDKVREHSAPSR